MLCVKTFVGPSRVHELGLFAAESIPIGSVVYRASPGLDLDISESEFASRSSSEQAFLKHYGWQGKHDRRWHLSHDNIRFCNHADVPNIAKGQVGGETCLVATRAIAAGEEIFHDYREIEELRPEFR